MADPTKYTPEYSYSGWQATNPSRPLPADEVDNDFANVSRSVNQTIDALKDVRRSDGKLKNQSVGPDQLSPALTIGFTFTGTWIDGQSYSAGDGVVKDDTFYSAKIAHTADVSNAPGNNAYWNELFSLNDIVVTGGMALPRDSFVGDGVTNDFTLSFTPLSKFNLFVQVGGVVQGTDAYSSNGNTLTFINPPPNGYGIEVRGFATVSTLVTPEDGSVTTEKLADLSVTEAKLATEVATKLNGALQSDDIGNTVQAHSANLDVIASSIVSPAFNADFTVTVGAGGDFSTINGALAALSLTYGPRYKKGGVSAEINLLSGFVMAEQVVVDKIDLGWISITSVDATVTIQRSALTEPQYSLYYPAFTASRGGRLPIIACQFVMDTSGTADQRNEIFIVDGSWGRVEPSCGVRNAGGRGLHVANTSSCVARATDFSGAGECAVRNSNSQVEVRQANLQNSGIGLKLAGAGTTDAEDANISGCTLGVENYESTLRFGNGIANNCGTGAYIEGGHVEADFASFNNCTVRGVEARLASRVNLRSASINSCGEHALLVSASAVAAPSLSATNAAASAVYGISGAQISVPDGILTGAGAYGVLAEDGSTINAGSTDTTGAATFGYMINRGSFINANGGTGTTGRAINSSSNHGMIFKDP